MKKGKCAKAVVIAIIKTKSGELFIGTNWCYRPQKKCPREHIASGSNYELCYEICHTAGHAEIDACKNAGEKAKGAKLFLIGHSFCCDNCKKVMKEYGIKTVIILDL